MEIVVASVDAFAAGGLTHLRTRDGCQRKHPATRGELEPEWLPPQLVALHRSRGDVVKRAALITLILVIAGAVAFGASKAQPKFDPKLPTLGTKFQSLPPGHGKSLVEASCFPCHSADML